MARFVPLHAANGQVVIINPEHVVLVTGAVDDKGVAILGSSMVAFAGGSPPMLVSKPPGDVTELLEGGVVVSG